MKFNRRVIITGPTGAIGMALIKRCVEERIHVVAVCHRASLRIAQIPKSGYIHVVEAELAEFEHLGKKELGLAEMEKADIFYHLAWEGTMGDARNNMPLQIKNIEYTIDAVELAARLGCDAFVGAGSQAEYGRVEGILTAGTPTFPENGYGMAKLCAGQMSRQRCKLLGIRHIWGRILSVYGPYDGQVSMVMSTIRKLVAGERAGFTVGEQMWDYLYSEDAAEALFLLGEKGICGRTYVLGSGKTKPLKEYILQIQQEVRRQNGSVGEIGLGDIPYAENQIMYLEADITTLVQDTGFEPKIPFAVGIERTVRHCIGK